MEYNFHKYVLTSVLSHEQIIVVFSLLQNESFISTKGVDPHSKPKPLALHGVSHIFFKFVAMSGKNWGGGVAICYS